MNNDIYRFVHDSIIYCIEMLEIFKNSLAISYVNAQFIIINATFVRDYTNPRILAIIRSSMRLM